MTDPDLNAFYDVVQATKGRFARLGMWTVLSHGIPWRHFTNPESAHRNATDPAWRAELRELRGEAAQHHAEIPLKTSICRTRATNACRTVSHDPASFTVWLG